MAVDQDGAVINRPDAGDGIEHRTFAGTVGADDGNEIAILHREAKIVEGMFLGDRAGIEGLENMTQFKHCMHDHASVSYFFACRLALAKEERRLPCR